MSSPRLVLVLGGTRSGKSELAERLAAEPGRPVRYLATAPSGPDGDAARIVAHQQRRPADWETVELAGDRQARVGRRTGAGDRGERL